MVKIECKPNGAATQLRLAIRIMRIQGSHRSYWGRRMGLLMGVFMGALTDMTPPVTMIEGKEVPQAPLKEQMRTT